MSLGTSLAKLVNVAVLAGCVLTKMPQLARVLHARSVLGISELSLVIESVGYSATCFYHLLLHYPFAAWGECAVVAVQNAVLLVTFWKLKPGIDRRLRALFVGAWALCSLWLLVSHVPEYVVSAIGYSPTALFIVARVPQIALNKRQGHTGHLAPVTIALQLAGNCARIFTTLQLLEGDIVVLVSQMVPALLNAALLLQISKYRMVTRAVVSSGELEHAKK